MGEERDQDAERTPLWPPEPNADPATQPDWAATPAPTPSPYQPYQPYEPYEPHATPPSAAGAPVPNPDGPLTPWLPADDPWPAEPTSVSDAPTAEMSATPAISDAPTQRVSAAPSGAPGPAPTPLDGPTARMSAAPAPTDAATQRAITPPPVFAAPSVAPSVPAAPAPSATPPAPPVPAAPPAPRPAPARRSKLYWRLGVALAICVLLLVGALSVYRHAQDLAAQPVTLMASYCAALTHDDYHAAYALLSSGAQGQITEAQYLADAADRDAIEGRITACSSSPTTTLSPLSFLRSPRSLIFNATITRKHAAKGQIALTRDASGWHVAALSSPLQGIDLGPLSIQRALCADFGKRAYDQAFSLLSTPYQHEQGSAATFAKAFGSSLTITACAANLKTYSVNATDQQATLDAPLTLSFVGASAPGAFTLPAHWTLVREADGWRVDNIKPLLTQ